jgi:hypothetical protein
VLTFYSRYVIPEPDQYNDFFKPGLTRHFHSKWWTQSGIWRLSPHCFVVEPALWFVFRLYGLYALVVFVMFCCPKVHVVSTVLSISQMKYDIFPDPKLVLISPRTWLFTSFDYLYERNKGRRISITSHQEYLTHNVNLIILSYCCAP